jgi:adenylate kinase family enzyme
MRRIAVIGTTGSGKTTLAHMISERLGVPHVEPDALNWEYGWKEAPIAAFRQRVAGALSAEAWVADGNYSKVRDIVWSRADILVWLDYPLPLILWRLVGRTFRRVTAQEGLWSGNRESLRTALLSRNSLLIWALKTYRRRRREYPALIRRPEYAHLTLVRLRSPEATAAWLSGLTEAGGTILPMPPDGGDAKGRRGAGLSGGGVAGHHCSRARRAGRGRSTEHSRRVTWRRSWCT